jgi:peptidoglycan/LPS O-acetylase OafA/YrhL
MITAVRSQTAIKYIAGIDGVRAIAVLSVILFHYTSYFRDFFLHSAQPIQFIGKLISIGWIGVDFFLVLSGYLIANMLMRRRLNSVKDYVSFLRRRALRLLPAYLVCVLVFLGLAAVFFPSSKILSNQYLLWTMLANIPTAWGDRSALGDGNLTLVHFWSLALEWHFYIVFPLILLLVRSMRTVAFCLILAALASRLYFLSAALPNYDNAIYSFTLCRIDSLGIGALLATFKLTNDHRLASRVGLVGAGLLMAITLAITSNNTPFKALTWLQIAGYPIISLSAAMIIYYILCAKTHDRAIIFLESNLLTKIGRSSYSLYIWHLPFYPLIVAFAKSQFESEITQLIFSVVISLLLTCALAAASYRYLELKFMYIRPRKESEKTPLDIEPSLVPGSKQ